MIKLGTKSEQLRFFDEYIKDNNDIIPHYEAKYMSHVDVAEKVVMNYNVFQIIGKYLS